MTKIHLAKKVLQICLLVLIIVSGNGFAQVGIGTITPNTSAALDITSTTQGMLTPRMTTTQRTAITTPADGLIVYDTTLKSFYYYNSTTASWTRINSDVSARNKFKRIKSTDVLATLLADELAAGSGTKYVLDATTYYEINGTITFNLPIDINGAYVAGIDTNDDKLVRTSGNLFEGSTGGSIRNVTLQVTGGGKVFNLSGATTQNLLFRDSVVTGSSNVGSITGFGWVFVSIVQYIGNTNGIVYDSITRLLINNTGWFSSNTGIYEKLQGTFGLVQKLGGFMEITGTGVGFDVSSNPVITNDAVMEAVVYSGTLTVGGAYVKPYTSGNYVGYNFNNKWNVRSSGIPTEADVSATGEFSTSTNLTPTTGFPVTVDNAGTAAKIGPVTTSTALFRFAATTSGRLTYEGFKKRIVKVTGSMSFVADSAGKTGIYVFYIAKNGVIIPQSKIYAFTGSITDTATVPINGSVEMNVSDYLEVFVDYFSGPAGKIKVTSLSLTAF
ncbi:MAG TPA: hypothetical protein VF677_04970 [Flavobacterium sp.]|jgi:hypothetical protein